MGTKSTRPTRYRVNYAVSRNTRKPHEKTRIETRNGHLFTTIPFEDFDRIKKRVREAADKAFPQKEGWHVKGWCPADAGTPEKAV